MLAGEIVKKKEFRIEIILLSALVIIAIINTVSLAFISATASQKANEAKELSRAANLEVIKIIYPACDGCYNIDSIISQIKQANAKITKETSVSMNDAAELISRYSIRKLPAAVVSGEVSKNSDVLSVLTQYGEKSGNAVVINRFDPPYYDIAEKRIVGRIDVIALKDSSCKQCMNMSIVIDALGQSVAFASEKAVDYSSAEGKSLANRFEVKKIPSLIISKDITRYESVQSVWSQLNATAKDDYYVVQPVTPPYVDLSNGKTIGLVSLIYITDASCSECYNVSLHKTILERSFGVAVVNETTHNTSTGKGIISKYNITKVPTIVLSPDASYYGQMREVWKGVGTTESDGWLVFRAAEQMGAYRDLSTGNVVKPSS